ncbi:DUF1934 domain-containing protein [Niallia sp. Krafla_26]|uniref:DUF1934 domain-containing protein n=1 Tax=Niallia sp. Krafla_26 TaxID=3064703 RepID=UPI003D175983
MVSLQTEQLPVKITVNTTIHNGSEKETYELITFGHFYQKANSVYLRYEEFLEEGTIQTIAKISGQEGSLLRTGAVKMRIPFRKNKTAIGSYETPYGVLELSTATSHIDHSFDEELKQGEFTFLYRLNMQGSVTGTYQLSIRFEEDHS